MAADTLVSCSEARVGTVSKIMRTRDGRILGGVGSLAGVQKVFQSLGKRKGKRPEPWPNAVEVLELLRDGTCICHEADGPMLIRAEYQALGSGAAYALAAAEIGLTATEAVRIACKFDLASAEPIETLSLDD